MCARIVHDTLRGELEPEFDRCPDTRLSFACQAACVMSRLHEEEEAIVLQLFEDFRMGLGCTNQERWL